MTVIPECENVTELRRKPLFFNCGEGCLKVFMFKFPTYQPYYWPYFRKCEYFSSKKQSRVPRLPSRPSWISYLHSTSLIIRCKTFMPCSGDTLFSLCPSPCPSCCLSRTNIASPAATLALFPSLAWRKSIPVPKWTRPQVHYTAAAAGVSNDRGRSTALYFVKLLRTLQIILSQKTNVVTAFI